MSDDISAAQLAWFDYRKDYGADSQNHKAFIAGYEAAVRDQLSWPDDGPLS